MVRSMCASASQLQLCAAPRSFPRGVWDLQKRRSGEVMLGRIREIKLAADLQQFIALLALHRVAGGSDCPSGRTRISQPRLCASVLEMELRGGRPIGQVVQATRRKRTGFPRSATPVGNTGEVEP